MSVTETRNGNGHLLAPSETVAEIIDLQQIRDDDHLALEHGLRKITAYVQDERRRNRSSSATRVARHREKHRSAGEVQIWLPVGDAERMRAAGGLDALLTTAREQAMKDARQLAPPASPLVPEEQDALMSIDEVLVLRAYQGLKWGLGFAGRLGWRIGLAGVSGSALYLIWLLVARLAD